MNIDETQYFDNCIEFYEKQATEYVGLGEAFENVARDLQVKLNTYKMIREELQTMEAIKWNSNKL